MENKTLKLFFFLGPKKTKKMMKFLANFVLYYRNKLSEIEGSVNDIENRREEIDKLILEKHDGLEKSARSKAYREEQLVYNEMVQALCDKSIKDRSILSCKY